MDVKIPFGIKTVQIGTVVITTINILLSDDRDNAFLPSILPVFKTRKGKFLIQYTSTGDCSKIIRRLGIVLRERAIRKTVDKYSWINA